MTRKVVTRSTHRVVGYHASSKTGEIIPWESQIERDYFRWVEVDPDVIDFSSQPKTFVWPDRRYTPDALVRDRMGSFFVEVKPSSARGDPFLMSELEGLRKRFLSDGLTLKLVFEDQIRREPLFSNIIAMNRLRRRRLYEREESVLQDIKAELPATLGQLLGKFGSQTADLIMIGTSRRIFSFDITRKLEKGTVISTAEAGNGTL